MSKLKASHINRTGHFDNNKSKAAEYNLGDNVHKIKFVSLLATALDGGSREGPPARAHDFSLPAAPPLQTPASLATLASLRRHRSSAARC